jgi:hypothetical protein
MSAESFFMPVKKPSELLPDDIVGLADGRDIYLWGAGFLGKTIAGFLTKHGVFVKGFCDKRYKDLQSDFSKTVISPETAIDLCKNGKAFLILSLGEKAAAKAICEEAGLAADLDFISFIKILRLEAEIRIGDPPYMTFENFKKVICKLIREFPFLFQVDLAGENPRENPALDDICAQLEKMNIAYNVLPPAGFDKDYLYPYEKYIELAEKIETGDSGMHDEQYISNYDNQTVLAICKEIRQRPCIASRMFPVINADLSAGLCHLYKEPIAADNYLNADLSAIFTARETHPHCKKCQKYGIHRLDFALKPLSEIPKIH